MHLIIKPIVTEKSTMLAAKGKFELAVRPTATKIQLKKVFKEMYGVDVASVNVLPVRRKFKLGKNRSEHTKRRPYKKVIITTKGKAQVDLSKLK